MTPEAPLSISTYRTSEQVTDLFAALASAQAVMGAAHKDNTNPHFGSRYADLASVWEACRGPLAANGLAVFQPIAASGARVTITTLLSHKSGQWIAADLVLMSEKPTPQGIGSTITYGRRYGLSAMVGIAPDDDDGNEASASQPRGSKEAAKTVADKKLGKSNGHEDLGLGVSDADVELFKGSKTYYAMLGQFTAMKKDLGEKLYYDCLQAHGYHKSDQIPDADSGRRVYKAMGKVKICLDAMTHGEVLPETVERIFACAPESSRQSTFKLMITKLQQVCGDEEAASIYEESQTRTRGESQWALYQDLKRQLEGIIAQQTA